MIESLCWRTICVGIEIGVEGAGGLVELQQRAAHHRQLRGGTDAVLGRQAGEADDRAADLHLLAPTTFW